MYRLLRLFNENEVCVEVLIEPEYQPLQALIQAF